MHTFETVAERRAEASQHLAAFQYVNLVGIRSDMTEMLGRISSTLLFSEYTKHDISHADAMLRSLEWLIPDETANQLTSADWLMITLSVYLHDLGLLVTKAEFANRDSTVFSAYKDDIASGRRGKEYATKVAEMPSTESEEFLYQEFVREHHAQRIRNWINNSTDFSLGGDPVVVSELLKVLDGFEPKFRRDLGIVCESHHKDDLDDIAKYKIVQPYGGTGDEIANLQFAAITLRLADLLHVTKDRTPSLSFRLINPTDPKSVTEWHKQMAVVNVRPIAQQDRKGNLLPIEESRAIGFYAYFTEPDGFFALTGYLVYVKDQLGKINDWMEIARLKGGSKLSLPWEIVDESNLEAEGFLKEEFGFSLDKDKILQLLTGHTLYNNANVVVRELAQNGIDAVRLDALEQKRAVIEGSVTISWSKQSRTLVVEDNGTGMSQKVIERHFLRAGSSRYQDPDFAKAHPSFSPISRFGIGVLSAFMVADEVEVITCTRDPQEKARKLTLRALLGRYLIREYERTSPEIPETIREHGTRITLRLRAGAQMLNVRRSAEHWIAFPPCNVSLTLDGKKPIKLGHSDPTTAIRDSLAKMGCSVDPDPTTGMKKFDVRTFHEDGLSLAVAVEWSATFKEWVFMNPVRLGRMVDEDGPVNQITGTCIEGIRIDNVTPGFKNQTFLVVCNATGKSAPRTNVARSEFEATPERDAMLSKVYLCYSKHVTNELAEMQATRGFSPTWAAAEAGFLLGPLVTRSERNDGAVSNANLLDQEVGEVPAFLIERNGKRELISRNELDKIPMFWIIDSSGVRSIEALLKEIPKKLSLASIANLGDETLLSLPQEPVLSVAPYSYGMSEMALDKRQITKLVGRAQERRLDLLWARKQGVELWADLRSQTPSIRRYISSRAQEFGRQRTYGEIFVCRGDVEIVGLENISAVKSAGAIYVLPQCQLAQPIASIVDRVESGELEPDLLVFAQFLVNDLIAREEAVGQARTYMARLINSFPARVDEDSLRKEFLAEDILEGVGSGKWEVFDASAWKRGDPY